MWQKSIRGQWGQFGGKNVKMYILGGFMKQDLCMLKASSCEGFLQATT